jgi:hypothetical protein
MTPSNIGLADLAAAPRWVAWQEERKHGEPRPRKMPYGARGEPAKADQPSTWATQAYAARLADVRRMNGIGIELGLLDDPPLLLAGLDLDSCSEGGIIADWAQQVVDMLDTYAEISPSGCGIKFWFLCDPEDAREALRRLDARDNQWGAVRKFTNGGSHGPGFEIYFAARYFTVTWRQLNGAPDHLAILDRSDLAALVALMPNASQAAPANGSLEAGALHEASGADLFARLDAACDQNLKLAARWNGWRGGLHDTTRSAFDFSLCALLKRAGFTPAETRALIIANPHGAGAEREHDDRYFQRLWENTSTKSPPEAPEFPDDPGYTEALERDAPDRPPGRARAPTTPPQPLPTDGDPSRFAFTPLDWVQMLADPPREWVYGQFLVRGFVSVLGAAGGIGKTAYAVAIALAIASGRDLLKERVHRQGNVAYYNLEDPPAELRKRFRAGSIHHRVTRAEAQPRLFLDHARLRELVIAERDPDGTLVVAPNTQLIGDLIAALRAQDIRLLIIDPFVRSHRVDENNNNQQDAVMALWAHVADQANCAILLVHHFNKAGQAGDVAAFRGASAIVWAARVALTLGVMNDKEAELLLGENADERRYYLRADDPKRNLSPPVTRAPWFRLVSIDLDNATADLPSDKVQSVERWEPPSVWHGMPMSMVIRILEQIDHGLGEGRYYSPAKTTTDKAKGEDNVDRWAGRVIQDEAGKTESQATQILKSWQKSDDDGRPPLLTVAKYHDPGVRKSRARLHVNPTILAEMRSTLASNPDHEDGDC